MPQLIIVTAPNNITVNGAVFEQNSFDVIPKENDEILLSHATRNIFFQEKFSDFNINGNTYSSVNAVITILKSTIFISGGGGGGGGGDATEATLATRASTTDITNLGSNLTTALGPKATTTDINNIISELGPKATSSDIATILSALTNKATSTDIDGIFTALGPKATEATLSLILTALNDIATATNQDTEIFRLTSILNRLDVNASTRASEATLANVLTNAIFQSRINTLGQKTMANSTPIVLASDQSALTVNLNTIGGAATAANQTTSNTRLGDLTETAPGTDTASSGLNGRLQRIAQRLTSLIALFPSSIGTKANTDSLSVTIASNDAQFGAKTTASVQQAGGSGLLGWISDMQQVIRGFLTNSTGIFARLTDGTNNATIKAASTTPVATDTSLVVTISPNSLIGASNREVFTRFRNTAVTNTVLAVKVTTGNVYGLNLINTNASQIVYFKMFDAATVTLGVTAPVTVIPVPANGVVNIEPKNIPYEYFQVNSIRIAAVTGIADNNTTAPTTPLYVEIKYV